MGALRAPIPLWGHFVSLVENLRFSFTPYPSLVERTRIYPSHYGGEYELRAPTHLRWCRLDRLDRLDRFDRFPPVVKQAEFIDLAS